MEGKECERDREEEVERGWRKGRGREVGVERRNRGRSREWGGVKEGEEEKEGRGPGGVEGGRCYGVRKGRGQPRQTPLGEHCIHHSIEMICSLPIWAPLGA